MLTRRTTARPALTVAALVAAAGIVLTGCSDQTGTEPLEEASPPGGEISPPGESVADETSDG